MGPRMFYVAVLQQRKFVLVIAFVEMNCTNGAGYPKADLNTMMTNVKLERFFQRRKMNEDNLLQLKYFCRFFRL